MNIYEFPDSISNLLDTRALISRLFFLPSICLFIVCLEGEMKEKVEEME